MAENPERAARLLSGFDGTAVPRAPIWDVRARSRTDAPLLDGYLDFLEGAEEVGLEIGDIVSRRKESARPRTMQNLEAAGLDRFFPDDHVKLLGSERARGAEVAGQRQAGPLVVVDDYPHQIGRHVLRRHVASRDEEGKPENPLVIAAVPHKNRQYRIDTLRAEANALGLESRERRFSPLMVPEARLVVVALDAYTKADGKALATFVLGIP